MIPGAGSLNPWYAGLESVGFAWMLRAALRNVWWSIRRSFRRMLGMRREEDKTPMERLNDAVQSQAARVAELGRSVNPFGSWCGPSGPEEEEKLEAVESPNAVGFLCKKLRETKEELVRKKSIPVLSQTIKVNLRLLLWSISLICKADLAVYHKRSKSYS